MSKKIVNAIIIDNGTPESVYNYVVSKRVWKNRFILPMDEGRLYGKDVLKSLILKTFDDLKLDKEETIVLLPFSYENREEFNDYNIYLSKYRIRTEAPSKGLRREELKRIINYRET